MKRMESSHGPARDNGKQIEHSHPPPGKKHPDAVQKDADNLTLQRLLQDGARQEEPSAARSEILLDQKSASEGDRCDRGTPCGHSAISCGGCKHHLVQRKSESESSRMPGSVSEPAVFVRPKLSVSRPGDPSELEADRMAEEAVAGKAVRSCAGMTCPGGGCSACSRGSVLQRKAGPGSSAVAVPARVIGSLRNGGRPLDTPVRAAMEESLGADFSSVRVHTDGPASESAQSIDALAYTVGSDVVFNEGRYAPESQAGRKLLAHELAHVAQDARGDPRRVRRQTPASGTGGKAPATAVPGYRVEMITADEYNAATGRDLQTLPERSLVTPDAAGFGNTVNPSQWTIGAGAGAMCPTMPAFPLPQNATGFLWSGGHVSDFSIVEGWMTARGFRAGLLRHGASDLERGILGQLLFGDKGGWYATRSLNRGVAGSWANDWLFPYFSDATAVYPDRTLTPDQARQFADFLRSRQSEFAGKTYRYSPPKPGSRAWNSAFGDTPPDFVPPETVNCINRPVDIHETAIGGETAVNPGRPGPRSGYAADMEPWLNEPRPGIRVERIGPTMRARGAVGAIRVGGYLLLLYSAYNTYDRISNATDAELPYVVGEETGGWIAGWVGSVLASALGGAFFCAESGPGAILCAAGFGIAGGMGAGPVGQNAGHAVVEGLELLHDTPRLIETTVQMFGSDEDRRNYYQMREIETGEPNIFDLF
jgi:hypothetical protein